MTTCKSKQKSHSLVKIHFREGTSESEQASCKIEYQNWTRSQNLLVDPSWSSMDHQISIRPKGELWGIFPCLQTFAAKQIMKRLPVVESLIAIWYVGPDSGAESSRQQSFECHVHRREQWGAGGCWFRGFYVRVGSMN